MNHIEQIIEAADQLIPPDHRGAELLPALTEHFRDKTKTNFLLSGPPGTGKTHQCWAIVRTFIRALAGHIQDGELAPGCWQGARISEPKSETAREVINRVAGRIMGEAPIQIISESGDVLRHRFDRDWLDQMAKTDDWLVVDDIGFSKSPSDWSQEAIYHLANERRAWHRKTIWTTNRTPDQLREMYGGAIASRLLGGVVVEMGGEDRRLS